MAFEIVTIPCLQDNYAFLLHESETGQTALIDIPEAGPIDTALTARGWQLDQIWITHHHWDHIEGLGDLSHKNGALVVGASADAGRLPALGCEMDDGGAFDFAGHSVQVMDVSGHTVGHIAFYVPDAQVVFTADSLMAMGCGRLSEGTPDQMWQSMEKLSKLPRETTVCSGHEYTQSNARFAATVDPENLELAARIKEINQMRAAGIATVPSALSVELDTNPFLRASNLSIRKYLNMLDNSDAEVFAEIRKRKDNF